MSYAFAKRLLDRYPRKSRVVVALCSAAAAVIGLLVNRAVIERILSALFYGVIAWLATAAARDLIVGPSHYPPNRFPLPGLWRMRRAAGAVLVPMHLEPSDSSKIRVCSLGFVFLGLGAYLGVVAHDAPAWAYVLTLTICGLLGLLCVGGTTPDLYRRASARHVLRLNPIGVATTDGGYAGWRNITGARLVHETVRAPHELRPMKRRYLQISASAGAMKIDVTGVSRMHGLIAIIDHYLHNPAEQNAIGSRASLWAMRVRRRVWWTKTATRPDPSVPGRV